AGIDRRPPGINVRTGTAALLRAVRTVPRTSPAPERPNRQSTEARGPDAPYEEWIMVHGISKSAGAAATWSRAEQRMPYDPGGIRQVPELPSGMYLAVPPASGDRGRPGPSRRKPRRSQT